MAHLARWLVNQFGWINRLVGRRFGPVLADSAGKFNFLPAQDAIDTHTAAFLSVQRDDVSELGSTASRAVSEHNGSDRCRWHAHAHRDPEHRHQLQQQQQNEVESVRSCDSLSTLHSESEGCRCTDATSVSVGGSTVTTTATAMGSGHRREKQRQRRKKRDRDREKDGRSNPPVSDVESMHFEGHLLHRVCEVTGRLPDGRDGGGSGGSNSEADSDDEISEMSLVEDSGEYQLARLRRSPEMMNILVKLKALSTSLVDRSGRGAEPGSSNPPGGAANANAATGAGRGIGVVRFAQQGYLRLFEEMLGELLRTQREKSKVTKNHVKSRAKGSVRSM